MQSERLQAQKGKSVYLEVGTKAPDLEESADAFTVAMHVTIEGIEPATNRDVPENLAVMVQLSGGRHNRIYLEPSRISRIVIHGGAVKVWFFDRYYVALSG